MIFIDCESAGLRGEIFAAAMVSPDGGTLFNGFYRNQALENNSWLRENVEPNLSGVEYPDRKPFLAAAAETWKKAKETYGWEPWGPGNGIALAAVAHMGSPVEANFFQQLYEAGFIGEFDGPYPMHDTAPLLYHIGYDPTSEQGFAAAVGMELPGYKAHSALFDAQLTRLVWNFLTAGKPA